MKHLAVYSIGAGGCISKGMDIPVIAEICNDGTINMAIPKTCPPDTVAYSKNVVLQMERKSKMVARLRAKMKNQDPV